MKRALLTPMLFAAPAFAISDTWIKVGYGVVVLVALFVLYKLIRTTEEEEVSAHTEDLPWNEMKATVRKGGRITKAKTEIDDAFDSAKVAKWDKGEKYYD